MNERIKLLAKQAHRSTADELAHLERVHNRTYDLNESAVIYNEKFAELIVQECIAQIRPMWNQVKEVGAPPGYDYDTFDLVYNDCMNAIKEHFGVEE